MILKNISEKHHVPLKSRGPWESGPQSWQRANSDGPSMQREGTRERGSEKFKGPERNSSRTRAALTRAWSLGVLISPSGVIIQHPQDQGRGLAPRTEVLELDREVPRGTCNLFIFHDRRSNR